MHQRKNDVVAQLRDGIGQLLKANKVDVYQAAGKIVDGNTVQAGEETLTAGHILIAAGSIPAVPPIKGADLPGVVTSDAMLEEAGVNCERLVIIGGGVIGVEMASIYASLGKEVTIVEAAEKKAAEDKLIEQVKKEAEEKLKTKTKSKSKEPELTPLDDIDDDDLPF